jgi:hypothetical protein
MNPHLSSHPVIKDFLWLTKYTAPYRSDSRRIKKFFAKLGCDRDSKDNFFLSIGESRTMFAAHYDTADYTPSRVRRQIHGNTISTDGSSILGADDRAGIAVLLHLIREGVPGHYAFFAGEEVGRVGSKAVADSGRFDGMIDRVVCWDRMGETSVITHQMGERCCSDYFCEQLIQAYYQVDPELMLKPDDGGTYTDSYSFLGDIPECTNISVGYLHQHTAAEQQNARFLVDMAEASALIDWESLPVVRDPSVVEYSAPNWGWGGSKALVRTPVPPTPWTYVDNSSYQNLLTNQDLSFESWNLLEYADRGILKIADVEEFLFTYPEDAVKLLYRALTEGGKL